MLGRSGSDRAGDPASADAAGDRPDPWLVAATVAWAACLLYLTLAPRLPSVGSVGDSELSSWAHFLGTMVLAALLYLVLASTGRLPARRIAVVVVVAATSFGVVIEGLQALTDHRDPSGADALLDALGAAVGVAALSARRFSLDVASRRAVRGTTVLVVVVVVAAAFFTPPAPGMSDCPTEPVEDSDSGSDASRSETGGPTERSAVALYDFRTGDGEIVDDVSGVAPSLDLHLVGSDVSWLDEPGLRFDGGAARSDGPATKVFGAAERSGELTLEAWVRSDDLSQDGPARIATISDGPEEEQVNVHLGEEGPELSVRLRATCGEFNWWLVPDVFTSDDDLRHVAVTFADGIQRTYVDGDLVEAVQLEGSLGGWDPDYPLVIGNEATMDRPFRGDVLLVAIYDRALPDAEVARNETAGPGGENR